NGKPSPSPIGSWHRLALLRSSQAQLVTAELRFNSQPLRRGHLTTRAESNPEHLNRQAPRTIRGAKTERSAGVTASGSAWAPLGLLTLLYLIGYGYLLVSSNFVPYVFDNN